MGTTSASWIEETVRKQIGRTCLEDWKDRIARYWSVQIDQIDEEQLFKVLKEWYGAKEAKLLLRKGRSGRLQAVIAGQVKSFITRFSEKVANCVGKGDTFQCYDLDLIEKPYSTCTVMWEDDPNNKYKVPVAGMIAVVGNVLVRHPGGTGTLCPVWPRWISHSFWQCGYTRAVKTKDQAANMEERLRRRAGPVRERSGKQLPSPK